MFWANLFIQMLQWLWYTVPEFNRLGKIQELYMYLTSLVLDTTKLVPCTQNWRCNIPKKWKITIKFSIWTQVLIFPQERNMGLYMNIATCKWGVLIFECFVQCASIEGLVHLYLSALCHILYVYALINNMCLLMGTKIFRIQCNNNDNLQQILSVQRCIIIVQYCCS